MYNKEYTHQSAFPIDENTTTGQMGMTLLDYFAAKALQGCLAYSHYNPDWGDYHNHGGFDGAASQAYKYAAAMMEERKKYLQP